MKQNMVKIIIGIVIVVVGLNMILGAAGVEFDLFFDGWWTIPIIIVAIVSMLNQGVGPGNMVMLMVGLWMLASKQNWIPDWVHNDYIWGAAIIGVGLLFLMGKHQTSSDEGKPANNPSHHSSGEDFEAEQRQWERERAEYRRTYASEEPKSEPAGQEPSEPRYQEHTSSGANPTYTAIFGGQTVHYSSDALDGSTLFALFGGLEIDFRKAHIAHDIVIDATALFGGVDLRFPSYVRVVTKAVPIFGGVDNKSAIPSDPTAPVVTVRCLAAFGGITILA